MPKSMSANGADNLISHIGDLFGDIYAADEVEVWLSTPQEMLDGGRPIDLIEQGKGDKVVRAVNDILDGILT